MGASLHGFDYVVIGLYLAAMVGIGWFLSARIRQFKDYFLAGGALTTPLLICTLVSTYYGLDVTFGTSESGFYYGVSAWFYYSAPYYVFICIAALVLAGRIKRYPFMTLPDLLDAQYGRGARILGAIACMVYSMPILAMAGMMTLAEMLGAPPAASLIIVVGICAVYTMMGGLWADAISDTVQFVLMCVSLAVIIPLAVNWVGGFSFIEQLPQSHVQSHGGRSPWILAAWAAGGLTVLVEPSFYQRVFAAKDHKSIKRALLIGIGLWAAYDWGVVMVGMIAAAAVEQGLLPAATEGRQSLLAVSMAMLPTGLRGLMLGGILAAAMSTIDTYSLLASGNLTYDILGRLRRTPLSDAAMVRLTRIGVFVVMFSAALVSLLFDRMRDAWLFMASTLTAVTLVPVVGGLMGRPRRAAGLLGSLAGLVALVAYYSVVIGMGEKDPDEESYVLRLGGGVELWQEMAALVAVPVSAIGFMIGHIFGREKSS